MLVRGGLQNARGGGKLQLENERSVVHCGNQFICLKSRSASISRM